MVSGGLAGGGWGALGSLWGLAPVAGEPGGLHGPVAGCSLGSLGDFAAGGWGAAWGSPGDLRPAAGGSLGSLGIMPCGWGQPGGAWGTGGRRLGAVWGDHVWWLAALRVTLHTRYFLFICPAAYSTFRT